MNGGSVSDDQKEQDDVLELRASGKAMEARILSFATMPWDTSQRMQGFVDEIETFIRQTSAFQARAFFWQAKGRSRYTTELRDLTNYLATKLAEYQEYLRRKLVFAGAMALRVEPPTVRVGVDRQERIRRSMTGLCVECGTMMLPNFPVQICPICHAYPCLS
jgi:hypothetical protein